MTTPVTGIELVIKTDEVARGRREWIEACQDIQAEAKNTERTFREVGDADRVLMEDMRALSKQIEELRTPLRDVADATRGSESATRESTAATKEWIEGLKELIPSVRESEEETQRLARAAGFFGSIIGGLIGQGVLLILQTGLRAATEEIREMGRAAREEQERINALFDTLDRQIELARQQRNLFSTAQGQLQDIAAARQPLEEQRRSLEELIALSNNLRLPGSELPVRQLAEVNRQLEQMDARAAQVRANLGENLSKAIDRSAQAFASNVREVSEAQQAAKRAADEAARAAEQRQRSLAQLSAIELKAAADTAGNLKEELRLRREIIDRGIDEQVRRMEEVNDGDRERASIALRISQDAKDYAAEQDRIRKAEKERLDQLRQFVAENKVLLDALSFAPDMWQRQQMGKPVEVAPDPPQNVFGIGDAQKALGKDARRDEREAEREQVRAYRDKIEAIQAAGAGIADLSQQLWGLDDASANAINAITELVAGIASKNPAMIISGGVNLIGSIFGDGGREERQKAREARANQLDDINSFIDSIAPRGTDIEELTKSYRDLHAEGRRLGLGNHELARLTQAYANELLRLQEIEYQRNVTAQEDLDIRALEAQGRSEEAQARRFALDQQREMNEYLEAGYNAVTIAALAYAQAMEAEAEARRVAREQLEEDRQRRDISSDFTVRSLRLAGNDEGADIAAINAAWEQEKDRVTDLFTSGIINETEFLDWLRLVGGEASEAIREITEQYRDQTRAIDESLDSMHAQAELDIARVRGDTEAIQAIQARIREEQKQQQLEEAIRQGYSEAQLARLEYIQGLQDEATAMKEAAEAAADAARLFQDQADAYEDLAIRRLKVQGLAGAASEASLIAQQQREVRDAQERGFSAQYISDLITLQKDEREQFRLDNQARQQEAFDRAAAANAASAAKTETATDSRTTFSLAVGTSETTSNALRGLIQTEIIIQRQMLEQLVGIHTEVRRISGTSVSPGAVQAAVIAGTTASERAFGQNPSN